MLPRNKRNSTKIFTEIIKKGNFFHSDFFIIRSIKSEGNSRFSISVPKKIAKTAVERNQIKRRIYSIVKKLNDKLNKGFNIIIIIKEKAVKASFEELNKEIELNFVKSKFLK